MKNALKKIALLCVLTCFTLSCSSDDNGSGPSPGSRVIKYELTGNYVGNATVVYTSATGAQSVIDINALPWTVEVTAQESVTNVVLAITGGNPGQAGKTVTGKIYQGGVVKREATATAMTNGYFTMTLQPLTL